MATIRFELIGQMPAKKNTLFKGKNGWYNSKTKELEGFLWQLKAQKVKYYNLPIKTRCRAKISVWGSDRSDLNNQIVSICDLLEKSGIVSNDRNIKEIVAEKHVDNKNPKIIIEIHESN